MLFLLGISWYSSPVERFIRQDVQAERDRALARVRELEGQSAALQQELDRANQDRASLARDFWATSTENIIRGNRLNEYEALPDYKTRREELEESLDLLRRCRKNEDRERKELARKAIDEARANAEEQICRIKAKYEIDLKMVIKKERDAAKNVLPVRRARISGLHGRPVRASAEPCDHKDMADRHAAEIARLQADLTAARASSKAQVDDHRSQINELRAEVEDRKRELEELQTSAAEEQSEDAQKIQELEISLETQTQSASDSKRCVEELETRLAKESSMIQELKQRASRQEDELAKKAAVLAGENTELAEKNAKLTEKNIKLVKKENELEESNGELAAQNAEMERRVGSCKSQLDAIDTLRATIDTLQNELANRDNGMDITQDVPESQPSLEEAMDVDAAPVYDHSECNRRITGLDQASARKDGEIKKLDTDSKVLRLKVEGLNATILETNESLKKEREWNQTCMGQMNDLREFLGLETDASFESVASRLRYWKDTARANSSIPGSHMCDHSSCEATFRAYSKQVEKLNKDKTELSEDLKKATAKIELADKRGASNYKRVRDDKAKVQKDLESKAAALEKEKDNSKKALMEGRRIQRELDEKENPLREVVTGLRKKLADVTRERDGGRETLDTYRKNFAGARDENLMLGEQLTATENQRTKLATDHTTLMREVAQNQQQAQLAELDTVPRGSGGQRRRRDEEEGESDKEELSRPSKVRKPE